MLDYWFVDVFGQHQKIYEFCSEHSQSVHGGAQESALDNAKHILRYLVGTIDYGLDYMRSGGVDLVGFTDSDWAGSASDQKSTSGCRFRLVSTVVSWFSRKQNSFALSFA